MEDDLREPPHPHWHADDQAYIWSGPMILWAGGGFAAVSLFYASVDVVGFRGGRISLW